MGRRGREDTQAQVHSHTPLPLRSCARASRRARCGASRATRRSTGAARARTQQSAARAARSSLASSQQSPRQQQSSTCSWRVVADAGCSEAGESARVRRVKQIAEWRAACWLFWWLRRAECAAPDQPAATDPSYLLLRRLHSLTRLARALDRSITNARVCAQSARERHALTARRECAVWPFSSQQQLHEHESLSHVRHDVRRSAPLSSRVYWFMSLSGVFRSELSVKQSVLFGRTSTLKRHTARMHSTHTYMKMLLVAAL